MKKKLVFFIFTFLLLVCAFLSVNVYASEGEEILGFKPNQEYVIEEEYGNIYITLKEDLTAQVKGEHADGSSVEFTATYTTCCEEKHLTLNILGNSLYVEMDEQGIIYGVDYLHEEVFEEIPEEITFEEKLQDFLDKWQGMIVSALGGISGMLSILLLGLKFVRGWKKKIEESINLTDEQKQKSIDGLNKLEEKLTNVYNKCEEMLPKMEQQYNELLDKFNQSQMQVSKFKELVALLIVANPTLASNGVATQILMLLDEGNEEGVE